jgi:hypothetical protein
VTVPCVHSTLRIYRRPLRKWFRKEFLWVCIYCDQRFSEEPEPEPIETPECTMDACYCKEQATSAFAYVIDEEPDVLTQNSSSSIT